MSDWAIKLKLSNEIQFEIWLLGIELKTNWLSKGLRKSDIVSDVVN